MSQGPVPWSVLRATQVHEFAEQVLGFVRVGSVSFVPRMLTQPVAAREVGGALVSLVESGPLGQAPELAGPQRFDVVDLARRVTATRGLGRRVIGVSVPGSGGRAMRSGTPLPRTDAAYGSITFEDWLSGTRISPEVEDITLLREGLGASQNRDIDAAAWVDPRRTGAAGSRRHRGIFGLDDKFQGVFSGRRRSVSVGRVVPGRRCARSRRSGRGRVVRCGCIRPGWSCRGVVRCRAVSSGSR